MTYKCDLSYRCETCLGVYIDAEPAVCMRSLQCRDKFEAMYWIDGPEFTYGGIELPSRTTVQHTFFQRTMMAVWALESACGRKDIQIIPGR